MGVIVPNFRFGPMASLKSFYRGKGPNRPVAEFFDRMPWYFSVGFRRSVGRLKGRSDERRSVALSPLTQPMSRRLDRLIVDA